MEATSGRNERGAFLWYAHDKIVRAIEEAEGINVKETYQGGLACYLIGLVKSGHLQRAVKPPELSRKVQYDCKKEYLYRQTGKAYKRGIPSLKSHKNQFCDSHIRGQQSHELWRIHRTLPKWFRLMMLD
jgi:hypothetical protein